MTTAYQFIILRTQGWDERASHRKDRVPIALQHSGIDPISYPSHSAFLACSLRFGAVPSAVTLPFSISAAHSAAPTVLVKANKIEAIGTNSRRTAAIPKLIRNVISKSNDPRKDVIVTSYMQLCSPRYASASEHYSTPSIESTCYVQLAPLSFLEESQK